MFRFCVLSAVSKETQATEDKDSLDHQLQVARAYGEKMGGTFVREYRADGYSRSGYFNLSDVFADAPPLGELARDAALHKFDVIILESYDRLGDVGFMMWNYLKPHKIQLRSFQQKLPIEEPQEYDPKYDDLTPKTINQSLNDNVYRIHKLNRAFDVGINRRVEDGKYAKRLPYGYVKVDDNNVAIVPNIAGLLSKFPAWYLGGMSTREIANKANESGVLSRFGKPWRQNAVIYVLQSPFYAGKVYLARGRNDKATKRYVKLRDPEIVDGKHEALWSYETHLKILDEFKRRRDNKQFKKVYNLTSVLKCSECGQSLLISYDKATSNRMYWRCPLAHVHLKKEYAEREVVKGLTALFASDAAVSSQETLGATDYTDRELQAVKRQYGREKRVFEAGGYEPEQYAEILKALRARENELLDVERVKAEQERQNVERAEVVLKMRDLIPVLPIWLTQSEPAEVRYHLLRAVRVVCHPDKRIDVTLI